MLAGNSGTLGGWVALYFVEFNPIENNRSKIPGINGR
jgi:hypothetical protein